VLKVLQAQLAHKVPKVQQVLVVQQVPKVLKEQLVL
jgi:hypothetical protein